MATAFEQSNAEHRIKRVLRHRATGEYFKDDGWTKNPGEAKSFGNIVEVAEVCARCGLMDVELMLYVSASGAELFCTPMR